MTFDRFPELDGFQNGRGDPDPAPGGFGPLFEHSALFEKFDRLGGRRRRHPELVRSVGDGGVRIDEEFVQERQRAVLLVELRPELLAQLENRLTLIDGAVGFLRAIGPLGYGKKTSPGVRASPPNRAA